MKKINRWQVAVVFLLCFFLIAGVVEYTRFHNLRIKGWLFGDTSWTGQQSWQVAGKVDTLLVSGIDEDCYLFLQADSVTCKVPLYVFDLVDDTAFVKCDSSLTTDNGYDWMVIRQ